MTLYEWANISVGLLTAGILAWTLIWVRRYTLAARDEVRTAQEQIRVSERMAEFGFEQVEAGQKPCLAVRYFRGEEFASNDLGVIGFSNIGNGPALNFTYLISFPPNEPLDEHAELSLGCGESHRSSVHSTLDQGKPLLVTFDETGFHAVADPVGACVVYAFYNSMSGMSYETRVELTRLPSGHWHIGKSVFGKVRDRLFAERHPELMVPIRL